MEVLRIRGTGERSRIEDKVLEGKGEQFKTQTVFRLPEISEATTERKQGYERDWLKGKQVVGLRLRVVSVFG